MAMSLVCAACPSAVYAYRIASASPWYQRSLQSISHLVPAIRKLDFRFFFLQICCRCYFTTKDYSSI